MNGRKNFRTNNERDTGGRASGITRTGSGFIWGPRRSSRWCATHASCCPCR